MQQVAADNGNLQTAAVARRQGGRLTPGHKSDDPEGGQDGR
jgi:hypothetical protein